MAASPGPATKSELRTMLDDLLLRAHANGVDVANGGYDLRHDDPDTPNWEVLITRIAASGAHRDQ